MNRKTNKILLSALVVGILLLSWGYARSAEDPAPQAAPVEAAVPAPVPASPGTDPSKPAVESKRLAGYKYSGFLSDYSKLAPAPDGSEAMSWRKPGVDFKAYDKILIERLTFFYHDQADYKGIDPTELKALADYFSQSITKQLGESYSLVTEPGPGVLRIRAALTDIIPNKPSVSVVTLVVPYLTVADLGTSSVAKGGPGSNFYVGHTSIEAEFIDAATNEQVAVFIDRYYPKKYDVEIKKGVVGAVVHGFGQYFKAYTTWSYTKDAFDYWAQKLRQKLDEAHGKKAQDSKKVETEAPKQEQGVASPPPAIPGQ
jgi:hypothetical protein